MMPSNRFLHRNNRPSSIHPAPNRRNFFAGNYQIIGVSACAVASGLAYKSFGMKKVDAKINEMKAREAQMHIDLGRKEKKMAEVLKKFSKENKELAKEISKDVARKINANKGKKHMSMVEEFQERMTPEQKESLAKEKSFEEMMNQLRSQDKELLLFEQLVRESKEAKDEKFWVYAKMWGTAFSSALFFFLVFRILEHAVIGHRANRMSAQWKAAKEEKEMEKKEANEAKKKRREEKRGMKEEERRRFLEEAESRRAARCTPVVEEISPRKRARITKNELKERVSDILEADLGEDADKASKIIFRKIGREACKKIIDNPDDIYEIIGESTGFSGSNEGAEWILERLSSIEHDTESKRRGPQPSASMTHEALEFQKDVEETIRGKGLDVENVKRVLVNGFNLNAPKRAIGRVYHRGDLLKKRVDQDLRPHNDDYGKVREEVLEFLWSHGVISTYKRGTCMMINTVTDFGQARPVTETGGKIIASVVKWLVEYKKMQNPSGNGKDS